MSTIHISKKDSIEEVRKKLNMADKSKKKGFDAKSFCGVLSHRLDPLDYQKSIRDEWNESSR
ncbi:MAG: hypothetical protein WEA58_08235 [Balneolaceae bacterium]